MHVIQRSLVTKLWPTDPGVFIPKGLRDYFKVTEYWINVAESLAVPASAFFPRRQTSVIF